MAQHVLQRNKQRILAATQLFLRGLFSVLLFIILALLASRLVLEVIYFSSGSHQELKPGQSVPQWFSVLVQAGQDSPPEAISLNGLADYRQSHPQAILFNTTGQGMLADESWSYVVAAQPDGSHMIEASHLDAESFEVRYQVIGDQVIAKEYTVKSIGMMLTAVPLGMLLTWPIHTLVRRKLLDKMQLSRVRL